VFFENFRRRSVRVLKLHRGFILTKKGDIPWGIYLGYKKTKASFGEISHHKTKKYWLPGSNYYQIPM
jgi:hypothetical protein